MEKPKPKFSPSDIFMNDLGVCLECHDVSDGIEPDARAYKCGACGAHAVYGLSEALMMEAVDLTDDDE